MGWELYVSADQAAHVFETLADAGTEVGLKLCGLHAMDSCRIEKAYRHFGHDITDEDHVLEAGLGFAVKTSKGEFLGAAGWAKGRGGVREAREGEGGSCSTEMQPEPKLAAEIFAADKAGPMGTVQEGTAAALETTAPPDLAALKPLQLIAVARMNKFTQKVQELAS